MKKKNTKFFFAIYRNLIDFSTFSTYTQKHKTLLGSLQGSWKGSSRRGVLRFHLHLASWSGHHWGGVTALGVSRAPSKRLHFQKKKRSCQLLETHSASPHFECQTVVVTVTVGGWLIL